MLRSSFWLVLLSFLAACAAAPRATQTDVAGTPGPGLDHAGALGVLVMAHGGGAEWNAEVARAVGPLSRDVPTVVAYGMADPFTLRSALDTLEARGVQRVVVVRLFLSGHSFLEQTNYLLGLSDLPPDPFLLMGPAATDPLAKHAIDHGMAIATHVDGFLTSSAARVIATERAQALTSDAARESVLLIAHGMGDEGQNDEVLAALRSIADTVRLVGFADVRVATLREDWAGPREDAERDIRAGVTADAAAGRKALILPMRLTGFGPYAEVLEGLTYTPGYGFLPHPAVADWVRSTAARVACAQGWAHSLGECNAVATPGTH